ncbi:MAG: right-handed parallel beta-helix repeat-containing protein [Candidatus Wallbacteria bacterium]|nr:right-handed parallel beta-helix repeat-containing protein [Candidatus Wallbacteria bacterium]
MRVRNGVGLGLLMGLLALVAGCGGGSGSQGAGAGVSKSIALRLAKVDLASAGIAGVTTVPQPQDARLLVLRLYEGASVQGKVVRELDIQVPPFTGIAALREIAPGDHLLSVQALDASGRAIFSDEAIVTFRAADVSFAEFVVAPVIDLGRAAFHGGLLPPSVATYVLATAGSPYDIERPIVVPAAARLVIDPGVTMSFATTASALPPAPEPSADLVVSGRLTAIGTADAPIVMTRSDESASPGARIAFLHDRPDPLPSRVRFAHLSGAGTGISVRDSLVNLAANSITGVDFGVVVSETPLVGGSLPTASTAAPGSGSTPALNFRVSLFTGDDEGARVASCAIQARQFGIVIASPGYFVTNNTVVSGQFGISILGVAALVEGNLLEGLSDSGIEIRGASGTIVNANTVLPGDPGSPLKGIAVRASNVLLSQNYIGKRRPAQAVTGLAAKPATPAALLAGMVPGTVVGVAVEAAVSGAAVSDRLVLDHNTILGCQSAGVEISGSDPVLRFNEISGGSGLAGGPAMGVTIGGLGALLPKQPLLIGNNLRENSGLAVGPTAIGQGGGVLGGSLPGSANYVADNNGKPGPDLTVGGAVDGMFDTRSKQLDSVDAVLSATSSAVAGAGAP